MPVPRPFPEACLVSVSRSAREARYWADSQEALGFGIHAQYLFRFSGLWAGPKKATAVADATSAALVAPDRIPVTDWDAGPNTHRPHW
uniref:hypothetical protein n=1 Tax=Streptomyces sp. NRRL S-15 TaxID=1463886 RepID=UPI0005B314AC